MTETNFRVFEFTNVGGNNTMVDAGFLTVRDDDGNQDTIFNDIETAGGSETNGDQEIIYSTVGAWPAGNTIRTRGLYELTNTVTGETFGNVIELRSESVGGPTLEYFIFTSPPPAWVLDGTNLSISLTNSDGTVPYSAIICFVAGTLIRLADGREAPVEALRVGDMVETHDGSTHAIRWVGGCNVTSFDLSANPKLRPIRIAAGALGGGLPHADLCVSPQHRVLVQSAIVERVFGVRSVLIPACKLLSLKGIDVVEDFEQVAYFHILLDRHRVIYSNGALTETLFTGPEALRAVSPEARSEIEMLFPEICEPGIASEPAFQLPEKGKLVRELVARHAKNGKPLFEEA